MRSSFIVFLVCIGLLSLNACKVKIVVPKGGEVRTQSEAFTCATSSNCTIDVVDLFFNETFVAVPDSGYVFTGWRRGDKTLCGGKREYCPLYTSGFSGRAQLLSILASDQVFVLEPNFETGSESNVGRWEGQWTNTSFGSVGAVTLIVANKANNKVEVTLDLDGFVGGFFDPEPQTVTANQKQNGTIEFDGAIDAMGDSTSLVFSLTPAGVLNISMPDLPLAGFDSFSAQGSLSGGSGFLNYTVNFSPMGSAEGTVSAHKT